MIRLLLLVLLMPLAASAGGPQHSAGSARAPAGATAVLPCQDSSADVGTTDLSALIEQHFLSIENQPGLFPASAHNLVRQQPRHDG